MPDYRNTNVKRTGTFIRETPAAVLLDIHDADIWFPKSECEFSIADREPGDEVEVEMPRWLAEKKSLL